jgi:hypothetical protein
MDDLALWTAGGAPARQALDRLRRFAGEALGLEFKAAFSNRTTHGMDFLGHRVFPYRLGLNRASRRRYRAKLRALHQNWASGALDEAKAQAKATALTAFTNHGACLRWRRRVVSAIEAPTEKEPRITRITRMMKAEPSVPSAKSVVQASGTLDDGPQAGTACCVVAVGSTPAGTPEPPTATGTPRTTATTTSVSGPAPAPANGRSALVEQVRPPVPSPQAMDETPMTRGWPVTPERRKAPSQGEPRVFFF